MSTKLYTAKECAAAVSDILGQHISVGQLKMWTLLNLVPHLELGNRKVYFPDAVAEAILELAKGKMPPVVVPTPEPPQEGQTDE